MKFLMITFVSISLSGLLSCGSNSGSKNDNDAAPVAEDNTNRLLSGTIFINDTETPAQGYRVFLLDHTDSKTYKHLTNGSGVYEIELSKFRRFHTYSLHVVDDLYRYVSAVTVDGNELFQYTGGEGNTIDNVIISRNAFGTVDISSSTVDVAEAGGFTGVTGSGSLDDFSPDSVFTKLSIGYNLFVNDTSELLNAFYLSSSNERLYQQALARWSGVWIESELANPEEFTLTGGALIDGSRQVKGGRVLDDESKPPREQPTWQSRNYNLTTSNNTIQTSTLPQLVLDPSEVIHMQVNYYEGTDQDSFVAYEYMDQLGTALNMPPLVAEISQGVTTTTAIDYSSSTDENGLDRPFCRGSGDMFLQISPPSAFGTTQPTYEDFTTAEVTLDYYYTSNGSLVKAEIETNPDTEPGVISDYPAGFTGSFTNTLTNASRIWLPHDQTLRFTFTDTGTMANHNLEIYGSLFLSTITSLNNIAIDRTRLKIIYKGPKHRSGVVMWIENCK